MKYGKFFIIACTAFYLALLPVSSQGDEGINSATKDAVKSIAEFGKTIGKTAKKDGTAVGKGLKKAGKKAEKVGKDIGKSLKEEVKKAEKK